MNPVNLRHLSLARKFALLGGIGALLFLVPFAFYVRTAVDAVSVLHREQAGIAPAKALLRVVQLTQQHRGLVNGGLLDARAAKQLEVDRQVDRVGSLLAPEADALRAEWALLAREWVELSKGVAAGNVAGATSFERHSELVARQLALLERVSEHHGLAFDAAADTHHLVVAAIVALPQVTESLGKARARGTAYLAAQQLDVGAQSAISVLAQTARLAHGQARLALQKAGEADAPTRAALAAPLQAATGEADKAFALLAAEVLKPAAPTLAARDYFQAMTVAVDAQFALLDATLAELERGFAAHARQQEATLATAIGVLGLLFALFAALAYTVARAITRPLANAVGVARQVAQGDLSVQVHDGGRDEVGQLMVALGDMTGSLRQLVGEVAQGAHTVADTSAQIAQGNLDLSQRTEEQASTLEETASSMEELTSTVTQNADNARQASQLAVGASEVARKGGQVVGQVVSTMTGISESSKKIADIIGVIDGIAFQTNILALNAAVEAARAGEQGRGFAVVAAEVRNLAQRSAAAAKEIKDLIGTSVQKVDAGTRLVDDAGKTMADIVASVKQVSDLIAEIAAASQEQSMGIEQVNTAITQMDQVVQQNASLVEEATAATESMKEQSATLLGTVARFNLGTGRSPAPIALAPAPIRVRPARQLPPARPARLNGSAPRRAQAEWTEF